MLRVLLVRAWANRSLVCMSLGPGMPQQERRPGICCLTAMAHVGVLTSCMGGAMHERKAVFGPMGLKGDWGVILVLG